MTPTIPPYKLARVMLQKAPDVRTDIVTRRESDGREQSHCVDRQQTAQADTPYV